jgi:hypothetical protein
MSYARVTSRKGIETLMEANLWLKKEPVQIRGEINRIYAYFALRRKIGPPPWPGFLPDDKAMAYPFEETPALAASAEIVFNLTKPWKGDGGGSEYATLYAMRAGCITAVDKAWIEAWPSPMDEFVFPISGAQDVIRLMKDRSIKAPDMQGYLRKHHDPATIARLVESYVGH